MRWVICFLFLGLYHGISAQDQDKKSKYQIGVNIWPEIDNDFNEYALSSIMFRMNIGDYLLRTKFGFSFNGAYPNTDAEIDLYSIATYLAFGIEKSWWEYKSIACSSGIEVFYYRDKFEYYQKKKFQKYEIRNQLGAAIFSNLSITFHEKFILLLESSINLRKVSDWSYSERLHGTITEINIDKTQSQNNAKFHPISALTFLYKF